MCAVGMLAIVPNAGAQDYSVIDSIYAGNVTQGIAVNPVTSRIYVAALGDNAVYVINGKTNSVITSIPVGVWPRSVAVDPATNRIYAGNSESASISVIDGFSNSVVDTIAVGSGPNIKLNADTDRLYVSNFNDDTVTVIDTTTNTVIATIAVGRFPAGVAINSIANIIYVSNRFEDTVSVIDGETNSVVDTIAVGFYPGRPDYNSITNQLYLPIRFDGVWVFDGADNTHVTTIPLDSEPTGVVVDATRNHIYVSNPGDATVSVIDGVSNRVIDTISVGPEPSSGIAVNPLTDRVYVAHKGNTTLSVIGSVAPRERARLIVRTDGANGDGAPCPVPRSRSTYSTIQAAVYCARKGDVIHVARGVFVGGTSIDKYITIVGRGPNKTVLMGGFDIRASVTIKHLTISKPIGAGPASDGGLLETLAPGKRLVVEDCWLVNGQAGDGGAIKVNYDTEVVIKNSVLASNQAIGGTGGAITNHGKLKIRDSIITGNTADFGAGIYNRGALFVISAVISGNHAKSAGGGIFNEGGTVTLWSKPKIFNNSPTDCVGCR
jgi:YVTN family beta-propeller protein